MMNQTEPCSGPAYARIKKTSGIAKGGRFCEVEANLFAMERPGPSEVLIHRIRFARDADIGPSSAAMTWSCAVRDDAVTVRIASF
jgi:hypothetical protein